MEASKVIFGRETRAALSSRPMSPKHRIKLRQERVKDYIRSKPVGATISITELGIAAGFPGNTSGGWQFIRSMVRSGEIVKEDRGGPRTVSWSIPNEPRTLKEADRDHIATVEPPQPVTPDPPQRVVSLPTITNLEEMAKDYAWETGDDSLRGFIKWFKVKTLDGMVR